MFHNHESLHICYNKEIIHKGGHAAMELIGMFLPFLLLLIYLAIIGFSLWFCISLIKSQKERNQILREISSKLDFVNFDKKEE